MEDVHSVQLTDMRKEGESHLTHHQRWMKGEYAVWVSFCRRESDQMLSIIKRTPICFN